MEFGYNIFYIDKDETKMIKINRWGVIVTDRVIILKNKKHQLPRLINGYGKKILDIYLLLFELGLDTEHNKKVVEHYQNLEQQKPSFKKLTKEQIDDIHARGKITPMEKVKEWERLDLCAPGDHIGSAADRCHTFENCHECLIDYASRKDEYTSFKDILKVSRPYLDQDLKEINESFEKLQAKDEGYSKVKK